MLNQSYTSTGELRNGEHYSSRVSDLPALVLGLKELPLSHSAAMLMWRIDN